MSETFGQIVKKARKEKALSQYSLAVLLDIDKSYLSKIENDRLDTPPSLYLIGKIASFVNRPRKDLAVLSGRMPAEDWECFVELYKLYSDRFTNLLKEMNGNRSFAEKILKMPKKN